ncbi:hypothetical protein HYT60_01510, partial [Candidatus Woesebacteria bacterium]|nr:hypothetical protein [Candidatus Woesebacteria bacterium]
MKTSPARKFSFGVIQLAPLLVIALLISGILAFSSRNASPDSKNLILSENQDSSGSSGSGSSGSSSSDSDDEDRDFTSSDSSDSSDPDSSGSDDEEEEIRTEVRYPSGVRIRTREKEGRTRVDIYEGGRKLRIETRNGITIVKIENEEQEEIEEVELEEDEELEVEASGGARLEIRTRQNRILLRQGLVSALTDFPVSVDQETGELTITTPAGTRVVTVLPEEAVKNMLAANIIDVILRNIPEPTASPTESPEPEISSTQAIEIEEEDGEVVYVLEGATEERFLGLINVLIPRTVLVSAESGQVLNIRLPLISRILE